MEASSGVSMIAMYPRYPTIKNRLNRLAGRLELVESRPFSTGEEVLSQLERGEISAEEAIRRLEK